jgi:hypothetical protein
MRLFRHLVDKGLELLIMPIALFWRALCQARFMA